MEYKRTEPTDIGPVRYRVTAGIVTLVAVAFVAGGSLATGPDKNAPSSARQVDQAAIDPGPEEPGSRVHTSPLAPDGLFYINAKVNGMPVQFIIDTGANLVVLTERDARLAGVSQESPRNIRNIQTVGGGSDVAMGEIQRLEIAGRRLNNVRAAIVKDGLGVSLLGQNVLTKMDAIVILGGNISLR
jgi:aspartyl protease family protein